MCEQDNKKLASGGIGSTTVVRALPSLRRTSGSIAALVLVAATALLSNMTPATARKTAEDLVPGRINPTGHTISMSVPFREDGAGSLGDLSARINPDDSIELPRAPLVAALGKVIKPDVLAKIEAVPDNGGYVSLERVRSAGLDLKFDPGALELIFIPNVEQRPVGDLSLGRRQIPMSSNLENPAFFSGYLNFSGGADYLWNSHTGNDGFEGPRFDVEAVMRIGNVVMESEFTYEGEGDTDICPRDAICTGTQIQGLKRRGTRLVYDLPEQMVRIRVGDTDTLVTNFQRSVDVLGVSIEKSPRKLAPGSNISPTGHSSFRLERPSDVEVLINGGIVQKLRLRPGNYNLSDLPLRSGANDVELIITDDTGDVRRLSFSTFSDATLLAPGISIWSFSGGVPSYYRDNEVTYRDNEWFASGFYQLGLTQDLTGEAHLQADGEVILGGTGLKLQTAIGFFETGLAVSNAANGTGYGLDFKWDLVNFEGLTGRRESVRFSANYRSDEFRQPGEFSLIASGIYYPVYDYWLRLAASYSVPLDYGISATLSGRYLFVDDDRISITGNQVRGNRYGVDLTLAAPITRTLSGSVLAGYSNEYYSTHGPSAGRDGEFRAGVRLFWRPDTDTRVAASYDSLNQRSYVSGARSFGRGVGRWDTTVDLQHDEGDKRASGGGAVAYYGNRFEARVAHTSGFDGIGYDDFAVNPSDQRTSLRAGTAIAFADGKVGFGTPIRSGAFALVSPHASIADKQVTLGSRDDIRAIADNWGPAVVSTVPAYSPTSMPYDVDDLPVGYSLGTSVFDLNAPYRAGYALTVGSNYSVSVYGTLIDRAGEPIPLLTGTAHPESNPSKSVEVFTNRAGKFGADGLSPGRWIIEMATETPTRFVVDIPEGTQGLFKAGTLRPAG